MTENTQSESLEQAVDTVLLSIPGDGEAGPPLLTVALGGLALKIPAGADTGFEQMRRALERSARFDGQRLARLLEKGEPGDHTLWH